jgi:uncharacterized phage-associated protein
MAVTFSELPDPLMSAVVALLKVAREQGCSISRTKVAKLLYLADLKAVEDGGTPFTGATWRWRDYGPYDNALMRVEGDLVSAQLAERHDTRGEPFGSCTLRLAVDTDDVADPLGDDQMRIMRDIVRKHGRKSASTLKNLSYDTPPMVEAQAAGDREVILDLNRVRRAKQARELLARHRHRRDTRDPVDVLPGDLGVEDDLLAEHEQTAELRRRASSEVLGDDT